MSQVETLQVELPLADRPPALAANESASIPWTLWVLVAGITMRLAGGIWDLSWHSSIGLDSYFVWPHLLMQSAALLVGIASLWAILTATFGGASPARDASVRVLRLHGPGGAFIALWGCIATLTAAPFDNWWHKAYGDVTVATPPHLLLAVGYFAAQIGATAWIAAVMNRTANPLRGRLTWLFLWVAATGVAQLSGFMPGNTSAHTAAYYMTFAVFMPTWLIACGWGGDRKWGCTLMAGFYTAIMLAAEWLLPLFPAQPMLGPVYHTVTHMIPPGFPLLLIVPAMVADLLLQTLKRRSSGLRALCLGPALVLSFLVVEWPFAQFMMLPASRNWIFGTAYFAFSDNAGFLYDPYKFEVAEKTLGDFGATMAVTLGVSVLTAILGLAWGNWLRRVCR